MAYYGRILAGDYAPLADLNKIPFGAIAEIVNQVPIFGETNFCTVSGTPQNRFYTFSQANWFYPDPFEFSGPDIFEDNLYTLTTTGLGGYAGPNSLLLTESVTANQNPATFTYAEVFFTPGGGTFGTAFPVSYSPIGDNPLSMCGYQNQVFVGQAGSTDWYFLAIAQTSLNIAAVVNYRWLGGPQK
jgi:hypothetical protein